MDEVGRAMLDFEARTWRRTGAKEHEIRVRFGVSPVRYRVRLVGLLDDPEAMAYRPEVVRRLRGQITGPGEG